MAFLDYEKAFDLVGSAAVLDALKDQGMEGTYIRFLDDVYKRCTGQDNPPQEKRNAPNQNGNKTEIPSFQNCCMF